MSIAANALHVVLVTGPTVGGASVAQVVSAAFWPVALIISVEVIARVAWPDNTAFMLLRWGGVGAVALVAAIVSYGHMHGLLLHWGESAITALLGPIGVDGLVTVGAVALMAIGHGPETQPAAAKVNKAKRGKRGSKRREQPSVEPEQVGAAPSPTPTIVEQDQPAEVLPAEIPALPIELEPGEPVQVGLSVDEDAIRRAGVPASMVSKVAERLHSVMAEGRRPESTDLTPMLPEAFAARVIAVGVS